MAWRGGQLSKNLKELRILFCHTSPASSHARYTSIAFVEKNYKDLKTQNPKLPILIREAHGVEPLLWARYDFGVEKGIRLEGMTEGQIFKALDDLVKAGLPLKLDSFSDPSNKLFHAHCDIFNSIDFGTRIRNGFLQPHSRIGCCIATL